MVKRTVIPGFKAANVFESCTVKGISIASM